jgi:hypothetical protein
MNKIFVALALTFTASAAFAEEIAPVAPAEKQPLALGIPEKEHSSGFAVAGTIVLAAGIAVALVFLAQKNKQKKLDGDTIEVLATRQLGGRAKLMLVSARGRELMLSVNDRGAKLLVEWPGSEAEEKQPSISLEEPFFARDEHDEERESASAAVSGLLRLRERTQPKIPVPQSLQQAPLAQMAIAQVAGRKNSEVRSYAANMQMQPAAFPEVFQNQMRKVSR